jgi:hypothetical protein
MKGTWWRGLLLAVSLLAVGQGGCGEEAAQEAGAEFGIEGGALDEFGKPSFEGSGWTEPGGKEDALQGARGLLVSGDRDELAVWEVKNQWSDTETAAAKEAGIAWEANSGLSWEQKYVRWLEAMPRIDALSYGQTFELLTPWGKSLPAPAIECAETAIFLRVTFASWYNLPFFLEARDAGGKRLYFGHFGMRTAEGRYGQTPRFKRAYVDHSALAGQIRAGEAQWPVDEKLVGRKLYGAYDDVQPMIGEDAHLGAYLDQIFLNKRVGYFLMITLTYFGSINLADPANTFNVKPEAVLPGDTLLERWQARGIGHALVVIRRSDLGEVEVGGEAVAQLEAELISGSMPRRQPRWDSAVGSKQYFTDESTGGAEYVSFGGGLKRWRSAVNVGGRWSNVVPAQYQGDYINSNDKEALGARPERFAQILSELGPEEKMQALAEVVELKRQHLREYPASCSARTAREGAFDDLYETGKESFGWDRAEVDRRYRKLEDYAFAELEYSKSKTCCWNSTTAEMYQIIMDLAEVSALDPESGECREVPVFMNVADEGDGYQLFRDFAEATGRLEQWRDWRADESCPQSDVEADTQVEHRWTPQCELPASE